MKKVLIYKPKKTPLQSGLYHTQYWLMAFIPDGSYSRSKDYGWVNTSDTASQVNIKFKTKEQAIEFANKKGYHFQVLADNGQKHRHKNYSDVILADPSKI